MGLYIEDLPMLRAPLYSTRAAHLERDKRTLGDSP